MKFLISFVIILVSFFAASDSVITRPDGVLQKLDEIRTLVSEYTVFVSNQTSLGHFLPLFRRVNSAIIFDVFNSTFHVIKETVANLGSSDTDIRATLEAETQNSCILSLLTSLDQVIELSGYAISNCVDITNPNVFVITDNYTKDVAESCLIADNLPHILFKPFIGRNVFTQPEEIIARLQELYDIEVADDAETLDRLLAKSNDFAFGWYDEYFAVKACLEDIEASIKSSYDAVQLRLPQCKAYGTRAPRSFIDAINIAQFFPTI